MLVAAYSNLAYTLLDDGIANVLGLETLRHGTNPVNYLSIRLTGGNPNYGDSKTGSTNPMDRTESKAGKYFYLFKDSELKTPMSAKDLVLNIDPSYKLLHKISSILKSSMLWIMTQTRLLSRIHIALACYSLSVRPFYNQTSTFMKIFKISLGILPALAGFCFMPTLRFRFEKIDKAIFQDDPEYYGCAYRTTSKVSALRIGLLGSLLAGANADWLSRAKANPMKILTGILQLTLAAAITLVFIQTMVTNPFFIPSALAGIALA